MHLFYFSQHLFFLIYSLPRCLVNFALTIQKNTCSLWWWLLLLLLLPAHVVIQCDITQFVFYYYDEYNEYQWKLLLFSYHILNQSLFTFTFYSSSCKISFIACDHSGCCFFQYKEPFFKNNKIERTHNLLIHTDSSSQLNFNNFLQFNF